jgi:hypothetical protein
VVWHLNRCHPSSMNVFPAGCRCKVRCYRPHSPAAPSSRPRRAGFCERRQQQQLQPGSRCLTQRLALCLLWLTCGAADVRECNGLQRALTEVTAGGWWSGFGCFVVCH